MFGKMVRSILRGRTGAKAIHVLSKTYSLQVTHPTHLKMMERISNIYGENYNEHEMAVQFLAEFSKTIKTDHPQAKKEVEKYIRMSKGAYRRGLAECSIPQEQLFEVARTRFGIEASDVSGV